LEPEELRDLVLKKGCFSPKENERIYNLYFARWMDQHRPLFKRFKISTNERCLDIGCSYGMNLVHFNKSSVGLEHEDKIIKFVRGLGLNVTKTNLEVGLGLEPKEKFELLWATDILVHLTSPYLFLLKCREHMGDDSRLVVQIPQYTPLINQSVKPTYKSITHYYAFNRPTLAYLLKAAGYEILDSCGYVRSLPHLANALCDPFLKEFGPNIWFLAKKGPKPTYASKQKTLVGMEVEYE